MGKVALVTDSTAYIPQELVEQYDIRVAPQVLIWDGETYLDGVDIQPQAFFQRLATAQTLPTSAQVSVQSFYEIFRDLHESGHDILAVLLSSKLSGTISSAEQAKAMLPEARIEIVDSYTVAMALGFVVLAAARAAAKGATLEACRALAEEVKGHVGLVLTVQTLEFLHRGGRIGGAARLVGTVLNIKPILEVRGGRVEPLEKTRTRKKALHRVVDIVAKRVQGHEQVRVAALHANAEADARWLLEHIDKQVALQEALISTVSPVIGTHVGPGTVGLAYSTDF